MNLFMQESINKNPSLSFNQVITVSVLVAALGYFVDIYDLVLFIIVRVPSLKALGLADADILDKGVFLLNCQMSGMLLGGILWGILGDKKGRLSVLFGSIFIYSIANIANGMVATVNAYALLRFFAGIGLAGELGAGITLVSEVMSKESRGYGTMIVAAVGVSGAVLAGFIAKEFDWRTCYYIGGGLGLALLFLRIGVYESGMFSQVKTSTVRRGDFFSLFTDKGRFLRYLRCILIGVPLWYVVGILISLSPEFAKALGVTGEISSGNAIMYCYAGLTLGDFLSGYLSQVLRSRKKIVLAALTLIAVFVATYFLARGVSTYFFYAVCGALGVACGYWAVFVTIAAEQFGTNLRATVATTVPNFVRGSVVLVTAFFQLLKAQYGIIEAGLFVGVFCLAIAFLALAGMTETFGKDLNYVET